MLVLRLALCRCNFVPSIDLHCSIVSSCNHKEASHDMEQTTKRFRWTLVACLAVVTEMILDHGLR